MIMALCIVTNRNILHILHLKFMKYEKKNYYKNMLSESCGEPEPSPFF